MKRDRRNKIMLQLRTTRAHRGLVILSQRRYTSVKEAPSQPQSKYKTELKGLIASFKKELGAVQASDEKEATKRKIEEQNEMQETLRLNKLENKKIAALRYLAHVHTTKLWPYMSFAEQNVWQKKTRLR